MKNQKYKEIRPSSRGRPPKSEETRKKNRTLRVTNEVWEDLNIISGGNRSKGVEELIVDHLNRIKQKVKIGPKN